MTSAPIGRIRDLVSNIVNPHHEACALVGLVRCVLDAGNIPDAATRLRRARTIFERSGAAEKTDIAPNWQHSLCAGRRRD